MNATLRAEDPMPTAPGAPARSPFETAFGRAPDVVSDAPGRVNLIGEHTDYSGGFVLPMAIPQRTRVELARRADRTARLVSRGFAPESFELGREQRTGRWIDYVQGVVVALGAAGLEISGFDAAIASDVPAGAGLSSSAALEVSVLRALRSAFGLALDDVALALAGRRAENELVGAPVGIMDQLAASLADEKHALFVDTRSLAYEKIPFFAEADLVVVDSGVAHAHAGGEYAERRAECERAARALGVTELRDVDDVARAARLPAPLDRRARHVITENARVVEAAARLRAGDAARFGALVNASHASLRDDFQVSVPDVDRLVALAQRDPRVFGARMTGGGFGGAIVAIVRRGAGTDVARDVARAYDAGGGPRARVLVPAGA